MNIKFYMSDLIGPGLIRGDIPAKYINRLGAEFRVDCKMDIMESDFSGTQIMVFQRAENLPQLNRMLRAKRRGIKCVYDIDDDLFRVPTCLGPIHDKYQRPDIRAAMMDLHKNADAIFASSETMAELSSKRAPGVPIFIVPNYTDFELFDAAYWQAKPHDGVVIGWHGSHSHIDDIPLIKDAVVEIMSRYEQVRFKIMGSVGKAQFEGALDPFGDRVTELPWVYYYDLPFELAACDIGLCPLTDIQFNRVRSTTKAQEYIASGVAVIASPLPCYKAVIEHGITGVLAEPESTGAWVEGLSRLIEQEDERRIIAKNARKRLIETADIRHGVMQYVEAYRKVAQMP